MTDTPPHTLSELMPWSPHTARFSRDKATTYLEAFAHWITTSNRMPATANLERRGRNTIVITVEFNAQDTTTDSVPPDA